MKRQFTLSQQTDSGGGFFIDPAPLSTQEAVVHFEKSEEESDAGSSDDGTGKKRPRKRRKRPTAAPQPSQASSQTVDDLTVPLPPDEEKPVCDECAKEFDDSFLLKNFDCQVCDSCRYEKVHLLYANK